MRKWLLPFSWLYGAGVFLHNKLFDLQIKKSVEFELPVISVGNLSTGGTGKTPHVEYLLRLLNNKYHCGTLSRGYKRKTNGYLLVEENSAAEQTGDEPLQMKRKFPEVTVALCEERALGIPIMLLDDPELEAIILDDAFQHRRVKPGLSVLLTEYSNLFTKDFLLPAGNLREPAGNSSRADGIVVTKCPAEISEINKAEVRNEVRHRNDQQIFFSSLKYAEPFNLFDPAQKTDLSAFDACLVVTGIASPENLVRYLESEIHIAQHLRFRDHHSFTNRDVTSIAQKFHELCADGRQKVALLTTEKDGVRLLPFHDFFRSHQVEISCVPVEISFSQEEKEKFDAFVLNFLRAFSSH